MTYFSRILLGLRILQQTVDVVTDPFWKYTGVIRETMNNIQRKMMSSDR